MMYRARVASSVLALTRLLKQLAGDDELLDFGGAFVDAEGTDVAVQAFDDAAAYEAGAAVNLHRAVDDARGRFGGEEFCFARFSRHARVRLRVTNVRRAIDQ